MNQVQCCFCLNNYINRDKTTYYFPANCGGGGGGGGCKGLPYAPVDRQVILIVDQIVSQSLSNKVFELN